MYLVDVLCALGSLAAPQHLPQVLPASFSIPDMMFLTVIALIVFGPKKLPEISRQLGKLVFEFRRASNDFKFQIEEELRVSEEAERQKQLLAQAANPEPATPVAISAEETVSTQSVLTEPPENTILPPGISLPGTGAPVSSDPPYFVAGSTPEPAAPATYPIEELQTGVREAEEAAPAALPLYAPEGGAAATHHG